MEVNAEGGSLSRFARYVDAAATLLDDSVHGREAEARALAYGFGREERLEDARTHLFRHAGARVRHGKNDRSRRSPAADAGSTKVSMRSSPPWASHRGR